MHPDPNLKEKYKSLITYKNGKVLNTIDGKTYTYLGEQEENEEQNEFAKVDLTDIYKGCENISVSGTCELSFEDSNLFTLLNDAIDAFTDADLYIQVLNGNLVDGGEFYQGGIPIDRYIAVSNDCARQFKERLGREAIVIPNIINELEKDLNKKIEAVKHMKETLGEHVYEVNPHIDILEKEYNYFLDKTKELKDSDK